jgi:hypothetical protein
MDPRSMAELKERHSFDEWMGRSTLQENLFVWKFFLTGDEIAGWRPHRIQTMQPDGFPPTIQSIWTPGDDDRPGDDDQSSDDEKPGADDKSGDADKSGNDDRSGSPLLRVDAYECASRAAAHEFLVQQLGEFQSPEIRQADQGSVGDVAFTTDAAYSTLFARANMVLLVQTAGRELVSVGEVAGGLDAELTRRPSPDDHPVAPTLERVVVAGDAKAGERVRIVLDASDPLGRPLWFKFFSTLGEVVLEGGQPSYVASGSGQDQLTVYAMNENRGAASRSVEIRVE